MKNRRNNLPLTCSISLLFCLGAPVLAQEQDFRVEPVMSVKHSEPGLDTWYKLGRFHQENKRYDMALEAYRQVLQNDPSHVEARNALATIYSLQNRFDEAIAEFQILLKANPKLAHVYNNMGYAHYLKADYLQAISAFGNAIAIDPRNARAFGNLVRAYEQVGTIAVPSASAPASPPNTTAASEKPTKVNEQAAAAPAATPSVAPDAKPTTSTTDAAQAALAGIELVIANGTRDERLGEYVANALRQDGATISRVTGLKPYTQRRNVILYREGFQEQALAVSRRFTNPPELAADTYQRPESERANIRLVLGKNALQSPKATETD